MVEASMRRFRVRSEYFEGFEPNWEKLARPLAGALAALIIGIAILFVSDWVRQSSSAHSTGLRELAARAMAADGALRPELLARAQADAALSAVSADGRYVAQADAYGNIVLLDIRTSAQTTLRAIGRPTAMAFQRSDTRDGLAYAHGDRRLASVTWNAAEPFAEISSNDIGPLLFNARERVIALVVSESGAVAVVRTNSLAFLVNGGSRVFEDLPTISAFAWGANDVPVIGTIQGEVFAGTIPDAERAPTPRAAVRSLHVSEDGLRIVAVHADGLIREAPIGNVQLGEWVDVERDLALDVTSQRAGGDWGATETGAPILDGRAITPSTPAGAVFRDCALCPQMVVIPPGELPDNARTRVDSFAVGRFEVTNAEYALFVRETQRELPLCLTGEGADVSPCIDAGVRGSGRHPVASVNQYDANDYTAWLSARTGRAYRLLTGAEWDYAARGGSTSRYPWGDQPSRQFANTGRDGATGGATGGRDQWMTSAPVGAFPANRFGLFDMIGNVSEWVSDCMDYPDCVVGNRRGGSWAWGVEFADRDGSIAIAEASMQDLGFRVAASLSPPQRGGSAGPAVRLDASTRRTSAANVVPPRILAMPNANQLAAAYPSLAERRGVAGRATVRCVVATIGSLSRCNVTAEEPSEYGFGAAALELASRVRASAEVVDGRPTNTGTIDIRFAFEPVRTTARATPQFAPNGRFTAQIAATQSPEAANAAWQRLSARAPELFASAQLDMERADLGARGVYYRVRAGYFADRAQAGRFCEALREVGQDCIVAAR